MLPDCIIGIDPSPRNLGIGVLHLDKIAGVIIFHSEAREEKGFGSWFKRNYGISGDAVEYVKSQIALYPNSVEVIMEVPVPVSVMTPVLYSLDSIMVMRIEQAARDLGIVLPLYFASPQRIHYLAGKKCSKVELRDFTYKMLNKNEFAYPAKFSSDESDALLLALWRYHQHVPLNLEETCKPQKWVYDFKEFPLSSHVQLFT